MSDLVERLRVSGMPSTKHDLLTDEAADAIEALTARAEAVEARIATIKQEALERAAVVAEEVDSGRCAKCGHPRNNHPYRHPFIGLITGDIPAAIRAMIEEKTDE